MKKENDLIEKKKKLLSMYGINEEESEIYNRILEKDLQVIYARLTFLEEVRNISI